VARLGQHFLTSEPHLARIVAAADLQPGERVLEIGPGTGLLTRKLLAAGALVVAIELDGRLADRVEQELGGAGTELHIVRGDAVRVAWPAFDKIVANVPYQISSPLLSRIIEDQVSMAVLTLQREFADRLVANPGSRDYSRLTVRAALYTRTDLLFPIPRGAFQPPPRVDSACVRIRASEPPDLHDRELFDRILDRAFSQRRKMLRSSLRHEPMALDVLQAAGHARDRPERLSPAQWVSLANALADARS